MKGIFMVAAAGLLAALGACTPKPQTAAQFEAGLPASYERSAAGADGDIDWHLDLLPEGRYQLRLTYLGKPAPNQFDSVGNWTYDAAVGRLTIAPAEARETVQPLFFAPQIADGSLVQILADGKPAPETTNPPLRRLGVATPIEPQLAPPGPELRGTYWKLTQLGGTPVAPADDPKREPYLQFAADQPNVAGFSGCNRIAGPFTLDGDRLGLAQLVSTRMACLKGMDVEQQFLAALGKVAGYRIADGALELLDADGTAVARFEVGALPAQ